MSLPTQSHIQLVIPAEPEFIGVARLACAGIANRMDLDVEFADDLKLVVTEACGHLLTLGAASIQVVWEMLDDALAITVQAVETPADPPPPAGASNGSQWGEIGLFLIHSLMDEVTELKSPPGLRMLKYIQESDEDD